MFRRLSVLTLATLLVVAPCDAAWAQKGMPQLQYMRDGKLVSEKTYQAGLLVRDAIGLMHQNNMQEALSKLQQAVALDPSMEDAQCNLGVVLARMGRSQEAITQMEKAVQLSPGRAEIWMNLANMYQANGQKDKALETYKQVVKRFPKHPFLSKVHGMVAGLEKEKERAAEVRKIAGASQDGSDYFVEISRGHPQKWNASRMPIKVFIGDASHVPGYKADYDAILKQAFSDWSEASGGKLTFSYVNQSAGADLTVKWSNNRNDLQNIAQRAAEGGEAKIYPGPDGITSASIVLLTLDPAPDRPITPSLMRMKCLHEVGHASGMQGHSTTPGDIMFDTSPLADNEVQLSVRDKKTIIRLYSDDVTIVPDAISINASGVQLLASGKADDAILKFEEAMKLDPKHPTFKENLAAALNNSAIKDWKEGKFVDAETKYLKALSLYQQVGKSELVVRSAKNYAMLLRTQNKMADAAAVEAKYHVAGPTPPAIAPKKKP
jgi:Flp pilus assembly protein TadD/predicted Zn-dependent protease